MATPKHSGRIRARVPARVNTDKKTKNARGRHRGIDTSTTPRLTGAGKLGRDLGQVMAHLTTAYSSSVSLRLALEHQNAAQDGELAHCVRLHITGVIADQIDTLKRLTRRLGTSAGPSGRLRP